MPLPPQRPPPVQRKRMGHTFFRNSQEKWSDSIRLRLPQLSKWIICQSHLLTPLTALTKKNVKFEWTKEHQQAFDLLKNPLTREVVLAYPDFSVPFEIYTDASKYQIGSVITQKDKPLAFYSRKLTDPQTRYTVTELELLAIVETLREYKCILLGHLITIYTDHKNLTFSNFTTYCVTRWRLIVEEYGPKIVYLPGKRNIIADALSCLLKLDEPHDKSAFLEEIFALDEQTDAFPITFDVISKAQLADNKIQQCITNYDPDFETRIIQ
jgi:ribonuclease HI